MEHPLHAIALCLPLLAPLAAQSAGAVEKLNIVVIMADDLGWRRGNALNVQLD
jgi:hypothetical protein